MRSGSSAWRAALVASLMLVAFAASPSLAQVKLGDFITPENATKVKNLVSPGVYRKVLDGMTMKIVATARVDWPPPYREATEKYSAQVRLSPERNLVGYVAGQPFPLLDPNDPQVGLKIMWNNVYRPIQGDDYDLRFYDCEGVYEGWNKPFHSLNYVQVGHYAGYNLVGRTEVEPMPVDPDFRISGRLWLFGLYPLLSPAEWRGGGFIRYRYADPVKGDDDWSYSPATRRLRRQNEAMLSSTAGSGAGANAWDPDHYSGFNAKTEQYNYKLLGERQMLACAHAEHSPEIRCATDGGGSVCPEQWEMRHMYAIEALPRREVNNATAGRIVIYMDSEMWFEPYVDTYDRKGELYQVNVYWLTYRDRPVPDAKVAIYPFKREFVVASNETFVQSGLASQCYLPGREVPERECWYIAMGAVDREFFSTQALAKAGH